MTIRSALDAIVHRCHLLYDDLRKASSAAPDPTQLLPEQLRPGEWHDLGRYKNAPWREFHREDEPQ